ncbi:5'-3' exonuclease [Candidatus Planktophila versatilis]|uniref:5'-3' exonuclease n=1 Tax=Candidatus Planktophila versatilis TaxID=1884905 RepID=A0AAD0E6N4_9ACTN|nr:5'-3' exonuclease [Candidatus Planktophila versatilis]ASY22572.1 5'-3' exonuclease [Candidatus Planktophila versatilis]
MTLMLLDSASLWYRAYYGMPDTLLSPSGMPVNAIRGYLDMTARLIGMYSPNRIVACIEGDWRPSWRVDLFPAYKANRLEDDSEVEEEPETLTPQIPVLLDLLDAFGIPMVGVDDYEADDVMATFAVREKGPIRIVTGDRDLFQLVDDKRDVKVVYLAKGISQHDLVDSSWVANKYGIPGDRYALFAMFRGDPSDGLPGVKGIGEKGAALIANNFASVEDALAGAKAGHEVLSASLAKKIIEGADYLKIVPTLVNCARDVAIPSMKIDTPAKPDDLSAIYAIKEEYGLGASVDRLISALRW